MLRYAITDSLDRSSLEKIAKNGADFIAFRDTICDNFKQKATKFLKAARRCSDAKLLLNGDFYLAKELGFDGTHLKSNQLGKIKVAKELNLLTIVSTHNEDEIKFALNSGADFVTYSPIFKTPNKPKPKGIKELKNRSSRYSGKIIALGGIINQKHIDMISDLDIAGFASIRYFKN